MTYLGLLDESNLTQTEVVKFYVTGVLALPLDSLGPLSLRVRAIRDRYGYRPEDSLKWSTNSRPDHVSTANHTKAKNEVLSILEGNELVFLPVLTHHEVARNKPKRILVEYSANMAIHLWERFLEARNHDGVCILDRRPVNDEEAYLRELFSRPPGNPSGRDFSLSRTHLLGCTMDGASYISSLLDVALGGFCYAINERSQEKRDLTSRLLKQVVASMRRLDNSSLDPDGYAFLPKRIKSRTVRQDYERLVRHWNELVRA